MEHVLTLIAGSPDPHLNALAADAREKLRSAGARVAEPDFLASDIACDLLFVDLEPAAAEAAAREVVGDAPIDHVVQPTAGRRKKLMIADMDSTIVNVETLDELAAHAGVKDKVKSITERAMRGEIDFRGALRERVAMLAGLPATALQETFDHAVGLNPGAETLMATLRAAGVFTALVSGGFTFFTDRIRARLGFDDAQANVLDIVDGHLTGRVREPIINRDGKRTALVELCIRHEFDFSEAIAVGDGANDLPMLQTAGMGVAYHAKPLVAAGAKARIDHGDLTALLYLQGYRPEEFRQ
tara:strand:+ start:291 stop:1187 length:897 start_codon:yes stop_codon:yes gene_type:complete